MVPSIVGYQILSLCLVHLNVNVMGDNFGFHAEKSI